MKVALHIDLGRDNWQERKWERPQHPNSMVTSFSLIEHLGRAPTSHENLRRILSGTPQNPIVYLPFPLQR